MTLTAHVIHGQRPGPKLFVCAAVHGDELNGVEIIRRLIRLSRISHLHGTLVAVPIVNIYGFIANTRYLPDRRDLNRSFPGSARGSLASQLANVFMQEIVGCCDYGIDLHTAAIHRTNFPQLRVDLSNTELKKLAKAFSAPIILHAAFRDGSLRKSAMDIGVPTLVYEAGEALRLNEVSIRSGVNGIIRVMQTLGMLGTKVLRPSRVSPVFASSSYWVRAPEGGLLRTILASGTRIEKCQILGSIADPYGKGEVEIIAQDDGVLIGKTNLPVVNQGDALFHIAKVLDADIAEQTVEQFHDEFDSSIG
jgi:predicted deacylase